MQPDLKTIEDVLKELDAIVEHETAENSPLGIFAFVYRRTTAAIKQAILEKIFEDNERMVRFDVAFAKLYLKAYSDYQKGEAVRLCWLTAFEAKSENLTIIQHLMIGMNAHINLDLGIAASAFSAGRDLKALENDFLKVNLILKELVNEMQARIGRISRLMVLLDLIGHRTDEKIINFSMVKARHCAWELACNLFPLGGKAKEARIRQADITYTKFAQKIIEPRFIPLKLILKVISIFEEKNIHKILVSLRRD